MTKYDTVGAGERWIPEELYKEIASRVPILCVDLLPLRVGNRLEVGLIRRQTPNGGEGLCLVGGAVLRNESIDDAVHRHVKFTLGEGFRVVPHTLSLRQVDQYFTEAIPGRLQDPRKHAVSLVHTAACDGTAEPQGEAIDFEWFPADGLPQDSLFGFGQDTVVHRVLRGLTVGLGEGGV